MKYSSQPRKKHMFSTLYISMSCLIDPLMSFQVKVHHLDPWLPQIDLAILGKSDLFIGNCISSFTSFVSRQRLVQDKPTQFWGYSQCQTKNQTLAIYQTFSNACILPDTILFKTSAILIFNRIMHRVNKLNLQKTRYIYSQVLKHF